ncbi:ankyrin-3-like [Schistocerca piceifrons]|uniref:ankyrin-3-like n=1 Tax=Schistocerca piceifrons TaxID=274613 RepID=UPI001F5F16EB|nr:ankyrin-3-like [Schistocerca piceifrons]
MHMEEMINEVLEDSNIDPDYEIENDDDTSSKQEVDEDGDDYGTGNVQTVCVVLPDRRQCFSSAVFSKQPPGVCVCSAPATHAARRQPPTAACDTPPLFDVAVSYYRSLSEEERARRLREAATDGAVEKLRALLAAGVDVGAGDDEMLTSLHCAAREGHVQAVRCLLDGGAQVHTRSNLQNTPLHLAAWKGRVAVVRVLLTSSADLNARNTFGKTPLHRAALHGRVEAAAALLDAGADRSARDSDGKSPLELARQNNHQELIEMLT